MKKMTITAIAQAKPEPVEIDAGRDSQWTTMNMRVTPAQKKAVHQIALDLDLSVKDLIMAAIDEYKTKRGYR